MDLHPLHPAAWVIEQTRAAGWEVLDLLTFTRASTLLLVSRNGKPPVVLKAGFGSNHVLAEMDDTTRRAAYGFYWYAEMTSRERSLTREDFHHETALTRAATGIERVVPLLEEGGFGRFDWYTMPYCEGGNFRPFLSHGSSDGEQGRVRGLSVLADVADGLHCLHQRGIVHRDVYQENILIHEGRGLVTDLGAARRTDTPRGPASRGPRSTGHPSTAAPTPRRPRRRTCSAWPYSPTASPATTSPDTGTPGSAPPLPPCARSSPKHSTPRHPPGRRWPNSATRYARPLPAQRHRRPSPPEGQPRPGRKDQPCLPPAPRHPTTPPYPANRQQHQIRKQRWETATTSVSSSPP